MYKDINLRYELKNNDREEIKDILISTNFFSQEEITIAIELVDDSLNKKEFSDYKFIIAECSDNVVGYVCYGRIPFTQSSYDLYWIAVHEDYRQKGIGKILINATEKIINQNNGKQIFVETSSRDQYKPTRDFYIRNGYYKASEFLDFYKDGEHKIIYIKRV